MSITDIAAEILEQLATIEGVRTCSAWHGEVADVIKNAPRLPALFLVYGGCTFYPKEVLGAGVIAGHNDLWTVVVCGKDLSAKDAAAPTCYGLIEEVRTALTGFKAGDGWLWPSSEALFHSENGCFAYALEYRTDQRQQFA